MSNYEKIPGGICAPEGFIAGGVHCGIKKDGGKDLALVLSEVPAVCAGVFTTNKVKAAPVKYCMQVIGSGEKRAIIVNSGCANAATGQEGNDAVSETVRKVAEQFSLSGETILVCSTGSIGKQLPVDKISAGIEMLKNELSEDGGKDAARAIMTTDTFDKEISVKVPLSDSEIVIGGVAKGAGMINPHMATMLCFVTTDAAISQELLQRSLSDAVNTSFNRITIDEDMSTNDTVLMLANAKAGNQTIVGENQEDYDLFTKALKFVAHALAMMIVSDGEGATKFIEVTVTGAKNDADAEKVARAVANSNLFKCALYGEDPNWGRLLAAAGYSSAEDVDENKITVSINGCLVVSNGLFVAKSQEKAQKLLKNRELKIVVDLGIDTGNYTVWTCDLSHKYIDINI